MLWKVLANNPSVKYSKIISTSKVGGVMTPIIETQDLSKLASISSKRNNILEINSFAFPINKLIGPIFEDRLTIIYIPKGTEVIIHTFNKKGQLVTVPKSSYIAQLIAIGDNTPFTIFTSSPKRQTPIVFMYNARTTGTYMRVDSDKDSNNPLSPFYIPK